MNEREWTAEEIVALARAGGRCHPPAAATAAVKRAARMALPARKNTTDRRQSTLWRPLAGLAASLLLAVAWMLPSAPRQQEPVRRVAAWTPAAEEDEGLAILALEVDGLRGPLSPADDDARELFDRPAPSGETWFERCERIDERIRALWEQLDT